MMSPGTVKRATDVLGSLLALMLLAPAFCLIALAVKLSSAGPILYRQKRIGQYWEPFTFLKFRSIYVDNDDESHRRYVERMIQQGGMIRQGGIYKLTEDPRLTKVGRFLRRASLDELPQFFNVLRGDMSLVGLRAPTPYEFEAYDIELRRRLFEVKPGITGHWRVRSDGRDKRRRR